MTQQIPTPNSRLVVQAEGYVQAHPEEFKGLTEIQATAEALKRHVNGKANITEIQVEEVSPGKWQLKKKEAQPVLVRRPS